MFLNSAVEVFLLNLIRLMILNSYHVWLQCGLHDHSSILNLYYKYNRFSVNRNNSQKDASVQNFEVKASALNEPIGLDFCEILLALKGYEYIGGTMLEQFKIHSRPCR